MRPLFGLAILFCLAAVPAGAGQVIFDAQSGKVVAGKGASEPRYPASITKLMTIYVALEAVKDGQIAWTAPIRVSKTAAAAPPVKLGLRAGETIRLDQAVHAALILSSNDAARVIAEAVAGSEAAFAKRMTATARRIGMARSTFRNASGLPDRGHVTTALDMARLIAAVDKTHGARLRPLFRAPLVWKGKSRRPRNATVAGPSGSVLGKTGFTCDAGFTAAVLLAKAGRKTAIVTLGNPGQGARAQAISALAKGRVAVQKAALKPGKAPVVLPRTVCGRSAAKKARRIRPEGWMISLGDFQTRKEAQAALFEAKTAGAGLPGLVAVRKGREGFFALLGASGPKTAKAAENTLRRNRVPARVLRPQKVAQAGFKPG
ncbi:MAG: serine hydrolase [Pseudomonadota bacterium]